MLKPNSRWESVAIGELRILLVDPQNQFGLPNRSLCFCRFRPQDEVNVIVIEFGLVSDVSCNVKLGLQLVHTYTGKQPERWIGPAAIANWGCECALAVKIQRPKFVARCQ